MSYFSNNGNSFALLFQDNVPNQMLFIDWRRKRAFYKCFKAILL